MSSVKSVPIFRTATYSVDKFKKRIREKLDVCANKKKKSITADKCSREQFVFKYNFSILRSVIIEAR